MSSRACRHDRANQGTETYYSLKEAEGGAHVRRCSESPPNATLFAIDNVCLEMPNGMRGVILPNGDIAPDRAAAEKAYGRPISENEVPVGSWSIMDRL